MIPVAVLSGAGGGQPAFCDFKIAGDEDVSFHVIGYPDWQRYLQTNFSAEALVDELAAEIARTLQGPIRIVGLSMGGHLGYAAALRLQSIGHEIAGLCVIDSFMGVASQPSAGWQRRAAMQGLQIIRRGRIRDLFRFMRSKFWRALIRLAGARLPTLLQRFVASGRLPAIAAFDPIFTEELTIRLMITKLAPWLASINQNPIALMAPCVLLRTRFTADDDCAWHRRCPTIEIFEIEGTHQDLFEPEHVGSMRAAFAVATSKWR
jgi:thioesterase domain-containing protein